VLPQTFSVECELQENVHLLGLLADDKLSEVSWRQLIKSQERQVCEDLEQYVIIAVGAS